MSQPVWKSLPTKPARLYPKKYHDTALTKARLRKDAERLDRDAIHLARTAHGPYFPEQVHAFIPEELAKYRRVFDEATRESFPEEVRLLMPTLYGPLPSFCDRTYTKEMRLGS